MINVYRSQKDAFVSKRFTGLIHYQNSLVDLQANIIQTYTGLLKEMNPARRRNTYKRLIGYLSKMPTFVYESKRSSFAMAELMEIAGKKIELDYSSLERKQSESDFEYRTRMACLAHRIDDKTKAVEIVNLLDKLKELGMYDTVYRTLKRKYTRILRHLFTTDIHDPRVAEILSEAHIAAANKASFEIDPLLRGGVLERILRYMVKYPRSIEELGRG